MTPCFMCQLARNESVVQDVLWALLQSPHLLLFPHVHLLVNSLDMIYFRFILLIRFNFIALGETSVSSHYMVHLLQMQPARLKVVLVSVNNDNGNIAHTSGR